MRYSRGQRETVSAWIRRRFQIESLQKDGINTVPSSAARYLWCCVFGHDMEPYNEDVMEPCKRCGIEDDRNCLTPLIGLGWKHIIRQVRYMAGRDS